MNVKQIEDLLEFTDHTACSKEQTKSESRPHNIVVHHTVITLQNRSKQKSCYKSIHQVPLDNMDIKESTLK